MASPQKENGFTPIANELLEKIYQCKFSLRELKIILAVIRFSYGFNRKTSALSLRFLEKATNIHLRHVQTTVKKLIIKNVLIIKTESKGIHSRKIQLNKNYDNWQLSIDQKSNTKLIVSVTDSVNSSATDSVDSSIDQSGQPIKKTLKKTLKKKVCHSSLPDELPQVEGFIEIWNDWVQYRKEIKKPLTPTAVKRQFKKLLEFKSKGYDLVKIVDTSISRHWQDFFEPKENNSSYRNNGDKGAHLDDY